MVNPPTSSQVGLIRLLRLSGFRAFQFEWREGMSLRSVEVRVPIWLLWWNSDSGYFSLLSVLSSGVIYPEGVLYQTWLDEKRVGRGLNILFDPVWSGPDRAQWMVKSVGWMESIAFSFSALVLAFWFLRNHPRDGRKNPRRNKRTHPPDEER